MDRGIKCYACPSIGMSCHTNDVRFRKWNGLDSNLMKLGHINRLRILSLISAFIIWALTCDFQQCGILTSVDSDEPVQPPFKLRNPKSCSVSSQTLQDYQATTKGSDQTAYAQAGLSLCWLHIPYCWKSVMAHLSSGKYSSQKACESDQDMSQSPTHGTVRKRHRTQTATTQGKFSVFLLG